jgi:hypothetical protein
MTVRGLRLSTTVPALQRVSGIAHVAPGPDGVPITQPVAVPDREKSAADRELTGPPKVRPKLIFEAAVDDAGLLLNVSTDVGAARPTMTPNRAT